MRSRTVTAFAAAFCTMTLLAGCADDATDASEEPTTPAPTSESATEEPSEPSEPAETESSESAEDVVITMAEFAYDGPGAVAPGSEITVENTDAEAHTVTADGDGDFDVTIAPGESGTFTAPEEPGEYAYLCSFHSGMTATLVVR